MENEKTNQGSAKVPANCDNFLYKLFTGSKGWYEGEQIFDYRPHKFLVCTVPGFVRWWKSEHDCSVEYFTKFFEDSRKDIPVALWNAAMGADNRTRFDPEGFIGDFMAFNEVDGRDSTDDEFDELASKYFGDYSDSFLTLWWSLGLEDTPYVEVVRFFGDLVELIYQGRIRLYVDPDLPVDDFDPERPDHLARIRIEI